MESIFDGDNIEDYFNSDKLKQLQELHRTNDIDNMPYYCKFCIGSKSNVIYKEFKHGGYKPITDIYEEKGLSLSQVTLSSNFECGMSCHMCQTSTKKFKEYDKIGRDHLENVVRPPEVTVTHFKTVEAIKSRPDELKMITFAGGDPLMNPEVPAILDIIKGRQDIRVTLLINGQKDKFTDGTSIYERLKDFPQLVLLFSSDGTPVINRYARRGFKADRWLNIYNRCKVELPQAKSGIITAITPMNIMRIRDVIRYHETFIRNDGIYLALSPVYSPYWYGTGNIPFSLKRKVMVEINHLLKDDTVHPESKRFLGELMGILNFYKYKPDGWNVFIHENQKLDKLNGTNMLDLNPEYGPYWGIV
jgi:organic radical activating enzyme